MDAVRIRSVSAALLLAATLPIAACNLREKICRGGEYPVKAVGNRTGAACVAKDQDPPRGYVRYPAGKEPVYVDDEWDRYWHTVVVDEHGNVVPG
ncbi:SCO0607 family lipoprotein [Dactylosporangium darangshiense]|uniref:Lipoprotein n=1 Tax=Dactylosporangium darangshiense TaxID=579108 RepID=A0ABP8DKR3_9ACTN